MGAKVMREVRGFSLRKCLFFLLVGAVVFFTTLGLLRFYSTRLAYHLEGLNMSIKRYADEETVLRQELSALIAPIKIYAYCKERLGMQKVLAVETLPMRLRQDRLLAEKAPESRQSWGPKLSWILGNSY